MLEGLIIVSAIILIVSVVMFFITNKKNNVIKSILNKTSIAIYICGCVMFFSTLLSFLILIGSNSL